MRSRLLVRELAALKLGMRESLPCSARGGRLCSERLVLLIVESLAMVQGSPGVLRLHLPDSDLPL